MFRTSVSVSGTVQEISFIQNLEYRDKLFNLIILIVSAGKSLSEALLFAEHGENMLYTKIVLNVRINFSTQHFHPRFELGILMY